MLQQQPHCKDLCFQSRRGKREHCFSPAPQGSRRDLLHACGFTVKHLSFCTDCVSDSRKGLSGIYWQLRICRWWTNAPLERRSCKRQRVEYPVKVVFISFACLAGFLLLSPLTSLFSHPVVAYVLLYLYKQGIVWTLSACVHTCITNS